jgi:hypothetical protein
MITAQLHTEVRSGEQQQHAFDDGIGVEKQGDDRESCGGVVHEEPLQFI